MPINIPILSEKDGKPITYTNLAKACKDLKLSKNTVYSWFRENPDKETYRSKCGITLTKTVLK